MIPLVGIDDELVGQAKIVREVAEQVRVVAAVGEIIQIHIACYGAMS
jgi:hypothetical protein